MNILQIIEHKKQGMKLTQGEVEFFIKGVTDGSIADYQSSALLMAVCIRGMDMDETAWLTTAMANSGDKLNYSAYGIHNTLDKHSTGGVGDTTSLALIPALMALGMSVGKMSGRGLGLTGGTLDKLESIQGFKTEIDMDSFIKQVKAIGGAIVGQTLSFCPSDKKLYALRDASSTVDSIPLIAASIMSKKIASGAENIVIDVKCGAGAFMKTIEQATQLGDTIVTIGKSVGVRVDYLITNMQAPLGDYIGNALEVFGAIEVLSGTKNAVYDVVVALGAKLLDMAGVQDGEVKLREVLANGAAKEKFRQLIASQGGDCDVVDNPHKLLAANCKMFACAEKSGYVTAIDSQEIAQIVFDMGGGRLNKDSVIDLTVGVRILKRVGEKVKEGQPCAELYFNSYRDATYLERLIQAFTVGKKPIEYKLIIKE